MVLLLPKVKSFGEEFGERFGGGLGQGITQGIEQRQKAQALKKAGIDPSILSLPEEAQAAYFKQAFTPEKKETPAQRAARELNEAKLRGVESTEKLFKFAHPELLSEEEKAQEKPRTKVPFQIGMEPEEKPSREPKKGLEGMSDSKLTQIAANKGQPGKIGVLANEAQSILDRREKKEKTTEAKELALRQETIPIRTEIAERGDSARRGIESKERLLSLIETKNLNDPTFATLMEQLPFKLGQRMLSPETVEYKGGLVDNYGDLKTLFSGATRVKEIDILENKIADIYLTDEQKKRILSSRINAHKADIIRAEAAAELEREGKFYGLGQFRLEVEKRAKPKLDALFNKVLDEQQAIIKDAENRKNIPLDYDDPEDLQIIEQIFIEAGKDEKEAEKLAKKKGYIW